MTLRIPEECKGCHIDTCVCRECQGDQADYCIDLNGNKCRFEGKKTCLWYLKHGKEIL